MPEESLLISNIWTQRSLGLDLSKNIVSAAHADVEYVCNYIYPFLQLVNVDAVFAEETTINFITTSTGWTIHDYGDAISTSAPHEIKVNQGEEANKGEGLKNGSSGIMGQLLTVAEIAALIGEKGWAGIELIAGTKMMQRFIWIESKRYGFDLKGYTPEPSDEKCYKRLLENATANNLVWKKQMTIKPKGPAKVGGVS